MCGYIPAGALLAMEKPFPGGKNSYIDEITRYQRNSNDIPTFSAKLNSDERIPALQHVTWWPEIQNGGLERVETYGCGAYTCSSMMQLVIRAIPKSTPTFSWKPSKMELVPTCSRIR